MNKVIEARRAVYLWLYVQRVEAPGAYWTRRKLKFLAEEPRLSAALIFGREMGHLRKSRSRWRMTATGMLYTETAFNGGRD